MRGTLILCLSFGIAVAAAGCGDDSDSTPTDALCYDYTTFVETPAVSFADDVMPIFRRSCALSNSCHASNPGTLTQPYLGKKLTDPDPTPDEIQAIFDENVGETSSKALGMEIIKAGDPENSFLMHKLDATLSCATIKGCSGSNCGTPMPVGAKLPAAELDLIRSWIKQGAMNN